SPAPAADPSPTPASMATANAPATPAASPSGVSTPAPAAPPASQALRNSHAQGELIGHLTPSEAHALMLEHALNQSELSLIALGQQILDSQKEVSQLDTRIAGVSAQHAQVSARLQSDRTTLAALVRRPYNQQASFFALPVRDGRL